MLYVKYIINYFIFPGFIFTAIMGMIASYIDRKVTARIQWRKGPPFFQPIYDFIKLLGKETIIPVNASKITFLSAPFFALASVTLVSTMIFITFFDPQNGFIGDIIVIIYLLAIPSISIIIGGFASGNPIASLGASREMKLVMSYELPFIMSLLVPVIKINSIKLGDILIAEPSYHFISGFIALIVAIICIQAKLGLVPFDAPEAEQEIIAGPFIEYSGAPLAIFKLTRQMLLFVLPSFLVMFFMPSKSIIGFLIKYIILLIVIILIRNTNPRLRIDQIMRIFWKYLTVISLIAIILALKGF